MKIGKCRNSPLNGLMGAYVSPGAAELEREIVDYTPSLRAKRGNPAMNSVPDFLFRRQWFNE